MEEISDREKIRLEMNEYQDKVSILKKKLAVIDAENAIERQIELNKKIGKCYVGKYGSYIKITHLNETLRFQGVKIYIYSNKPRRTISMECNSSLYGLGGNMDDENDEAPREISKKRFDIIFNTAIKTINGYNR